MTKKIFMLLAVVLLSSASAFAQSNEPLKGDVNEDGVVDVADIVAVIDIIQNQSGGDKTYYWYVGTEPITSSSIPGSGTVTDDETALGWHYITGTPTEIQVGPTPRQSSNVTWYFAIPNILGITKATSGGLTDGGITSSTMTLSDGVVYRVFVTPEMKKVNYLMTK